MEWGLKTKMIQLGNNRGESAEAKKQFQDYALAHIDQFDHQAWDMFVDLNDLVLKEMQEDVEYWTQVYGKLKAIDCNDTKFGFRTGMRIALMQTICEDELKLS